MIDGLSCGGVDLFFSLPMMILWLSKEAQCHKKRQLRRRSLVLSKRAAGCNHGTHKSTKCLGLALVSWSVWMNSRSGRMRDPGGYFKIFQFVPLSGALAKHEPPGLPTSNHLAAVLPCRYLGDICRGRGDS